MMKGTVFGMNCKAIITFLTKDVIYQALLMQRVTRDEETGLLHHAWDGALLEEWAHPVTGHSAEFWGRSMGWVPVALFNDLDFIEEGTENRDKIIEMATNLLKNLVKYQSEEGRWYQVVNKGGEPGNWLENSCSCLYTAALAKAVRKGYLPKEYLDIALKVYEGVINDITFIGDDIQIGNVCIGTGVGDYDFYIHRPVNTNDLHGVGAFLLMCTEISWTLNA